MKMIINIDTEYICELYQLNKGQIDIETMIRRAIEYYLANKKKEEY